MQKSFSSYNEGDVVILELPFTDLVGKKLRPVLVLSSEELNRVSADLVVAKVSSSRHLPDFEVEINPDDLDEGKTQENKLHSLSFNLYRREKFNSQEGRKAKI
jgi:mRNA interferase MazF